LIPKRINFFNYPRRELRRRNRQTILVTLGLAIEIGLVLTVSAASAGVEAADHQVLRGLDSVGTDITISATTTSSSSGAQPFDFNPGLFNKEGRFSIS